MIVLCPVDYSLYAVIDNYTDNIPILFRLISDGEDLPLTALHMEVSEPHSFFEEIEREPS